MLQRLGYEFEVSAADIDESWSEGETPEQHVVRLAREKARAVASARSEDGSIDRGPILAADTIVVIDGQVLGKPLDRADGLAMLARLSGAEHQVITAVAIVDGDDLLETSSSTRVWFRELSTEECEAYWETGEPQDKAGAYAIQGLAAVFVTKIEGSYTGVVGLPLQEATELLANAGVPFRLSADARHQTENRKGQG
jgi:septum formation protein